MPTPSTPSILITRKAIMLGSYIRVSDKWITNGHWAIRTHLVRNAVEFTLETYNPGKWGGLPISELTDKAAKQVLEISPDREWVFTGTAIVRGGVGSGINDLLQYKNEDAGARYVTAGIDRIYAELMYAKGKGVGVATLYGKDATSAFTDQDNQIVIMGARL